MQALRKSIGILVALIAAVSPIMAAGQAPVIRPGLWEVTKSGDLAGWIRVQMGDIEAQLKDLPPDQRAQVRQTIEAQIQSFGAPEKSCVSAEDAASFWQDQLTSDDCRRTLDWQAPGQGIMRAQCDGGRTATTQIKSSGADNFSMATSSKATSGEQIAFTLTLRRLGSECGAVKP